MNATWYKYEGEKGVDLTQKQAQDLQGRRRAIENELNRLTQQIHEMDQKIRFYLADRNTNPHPRHIEFVEKIQRYRIDPAASNKHLEALLDNLQWKIYYYQRAWNQMWENAEAAYRQNRKPVLEETHAPKSEPMNGNEPEKSRSQYSIETLWEVQSEKLKQHGSISPENKSEFKQRMYQEYKELSKLRKANQEIILTYDAQEKKCKLDIKDK
jgi:hypothetical protein